MPEEDIIFVGDSARCPYGPRDLAEVDQFVQQICSWLVNQGVKMIVIACNTATAAGLAHAQRSFPVPIVGVVEPGARAAVQMTRNRKVGVIATKDLWLRTRIPRLSGTLTPASRFSRRLRRVSSKSPSWG